MNRELLANVVFILSATTLVIARGSPADDKATKQLEGTWQVTVVERDGTKAPAEEIERMKWSIEGKEIAFFNPQRTGRSKIVVDASKSPKEITLTALEGTNKDQSTKAIYRIEKGRLEICLRGKQADDKGRPTEFKTKEESGLVLIVLERVKVDSKAK